MGLVDDRLDHVLRLDTARPARADDQLHTRPRAVAGLRVPRAPGLALFGPRLRLAPVLGDLGLRVLLDDRDLLALLRRDQRDRATRAAHAASAADAVHVDVRGVRRVVVEDVRDARDVEP